MNKPEWLDDSIMGKIFEITELYYNISFSYNTELKRLSAGPLIRTWIENINKSESLKSSKRIYLYSGHDDNIASLTRAHDFNVLSVPTFGSAVIFEKLKDPKTGKVYIKVCLNSSITFFPYFTAAKL